eukprot:comp14975_c1_seq2/m.11576 comp14975_c1_seq2/g.11576  ORF comp14975_c1_seq2/g.11576 comp14975_c1_seq2/m.11576 type:complete len:175 (-) comp14975_c1_seq2:128-652(-)
MQTFAPTLDASNTSQKAKALPTISSIPATVTGLQHLLESRDPLTLRFLQFLKAQHCEELLLFYWQCSDWKECPTTEKAKNIAAQYVQDDGPMRVNMDERLRATILKRLDNSQVDSSLFFVAQNYVLQTLFSDWLPRFKQWEDDPGASNHRNLMRTPTTLKNPHSMKLTTFNKPT